jgi:uncharacterized membrane protein
MKSELTVCAFIALSWVTVAASFMARTQLLLVIYFLIGSSAFLAVLQLNKNDQDTVFMFVIECLSLSLLLSSALASDYLRGWDVHQEYQVFIGAFQSGIWTSQFSTLYSSVISISILPSVIASVSGLDGLTIFRFVFPVLYSILPVLLYKVYRNILAPKFAYLAVFLLMSSYYDQLISLARQEVAELLLVVLLLIFFSPKIRNRLSGAVATVVLTMGLVMSHYTTAFLFVLLVIFSFVVAVISRHRDVSLFNSSTLLLTGVAVFGWYTFVAGGIAVARLGSALSNVANGVITDFLNPSNRPTQVAQLIGQGVTSGFLHDINRAVASIVVLCLILGFFALLCKRRKSTAEWKMMPLTTLGFILIGSVVILPSFGASLQFSRLYHYSLLFVSPCFAYGVNLLASPLENLRPAFAKVLHLRVRRRFPTKSVLAACILLSYFLFVSGWVWAVSMDRPTSPILDSQRMQTSPDIVLAAQYFDSTTVAEDVAAAQWLSVYHSDRPICSDIPAQYQVLNSYGEFPRNGPSLPRCSGVKNAYVFLREFNNLRGVGSAIPEGPPDFSISTISLKLNAINRIYSDGATIYVGDNEAWFGSH